MLRVRCPGPLGSCSPICTPGVLCCVCGVLTWFAPVHRCVRSACCVACAVASDTWLLFTGVHAWCAVLPVGGVAAGRALVHPDGDRFVAGRGRVPSGSAHVDPDGGCFVAARRWVRCRSRTRPSGQGLVGCGPGLVGRAASWSGSGAPHSSCCRFAFSSGPSGLCAPLLCVCSFFVFFSRPPCVPCSLFPALGALGLGALWLPSPPPFFFFFSAPPRCPSFLCFTAQGALGPGALWLSPPSSPFLFPPPCPRFSVAFRLGCPRPRRFVAARPRIFFFSFVSFLLCSAVPCVGVLLCAVFRRVWCRCALLCVVVLSLVFCGVVVRCVVSWSGPPRRSALCWLCRAVQLCPSPPLLLPLLSRLLLLLGPVSCSVLGCGADLFCCAACPALCCCLRRCVLCGALVVSFALAGAAVCCFLVFLAGPRCPLLSFGGVFCRWCPCLAAWPAALLCAVVCCGALLPYAVSGGAVLLRGALLWCPTVCFALLVVFVCSLPCSGRRWRAALLCCLRCVVCCSRAVFCGALSAALCCAVLACLRCFPVLCSVAFVVLVGVLWCCLWSLVVCRRVSLSAVVSRRRVAASASLVLPCCVLRCDVVPCCPVLCPVVLCCLVVLCCSALLVLGGALLSVLPCWWCLPVSFSFKTSAKPVKLVFHFRK